MIMNDDRHNTVDAVIGGRNLGRDRIISIVEANQALYALLRDQ